MPSPFESFCGHIMASWTFFFCIFSVLTLSTQTMSSFKMSPSPRQVADHLDGARTSFRITLKHIDSGKNFTTLEKIHRGIKRRDNMNNMQHRLTTLASDDNSFSRVEAKVRPGNLEFLMSLAIGTPPLNYSAVMDTGSDLIWTQCQPCLQCFNQSTEIFDRGNSSSFVKAPCNSQQCEAFPDAVCNNGCEYRYTYANGAYSRGVLGVETLTFDEVSIPNITFGCSNDNEGFDQGAGIVGLGRGPLSLVSQLKETRFAYCLTSLSGLDGSTLMVGLPEGESSDPVAVKTTPLQTNPSQPSFYYLSLQGISVGGTRLPIKNSTFQIRKDGSGGFIIDSGTTITYLKKKIYKLVREQFVSFIDLPVDNSRRMGLDLCFILGSEATVPEVPKLVFHFEGADMELPIENYMIVDSRYGLMCLAIDGTTDTSILGNVQQQNLLVVHDMEKETVSFRYTRCDNL